MHGSPEMLCGEKWKQSNSVLHLADKDNHYWKISLLVESLSGL